MMPWLSELSVIDPSSLRRLTRLIPPLEAKISQFVSVLDNGSEESDDGSDRDEPMESEPTPKKRVAPVAEELAADTAVKQDPGVRIPLLLLIVAEYVIHSATSVARFLASASKGLLRCAAIDAFTAEKDVGGWTPKLWQKASFHHLSVRRRRRSRRKGRVKLSLLANVRPVVNLELPRRLSRS